MWDTYRLPASGNFSLRKIAFLFLAVVATAFLWTLFFSSISHAADATWSGDSIVKDGNTYVKETGSIPGVPAGFQTYVFKPQNGNSAQVIYFPGNADMTKPFTAQQVSYEFVNGQYGNQGPPTLLSIDAKSTEGDKEKTQCDVAGIGWIICMVSRFLASGMDNFFQWISGFLEVKPITGDTTSGLYQAWSIMLGLANSAFVLAFLVIIYSQITSVGFNNYNIKKMVPKLIVAAILVNTSYYVCAVAVDISNILGHSLQQALIDIRNSLPSPNPGGVDFSWKNLTEYILSGGTIAAAGFAGWAAFAGGAGASVTALVPLLFPMLIFGMLAFITVLLVLAARQALITILIVVAPLAFVAYLLPNTEKWFEKWRELFTTMLMVFPMFSLLFGGSQLASYIIIQNADKPSVAIFGLFIQAAPLAITPFLVKFSGGLVGRLAGMISNNTKGLHDNAMGWAKERVDKRRGIAMEQAARGRGTFLQRSAFRREKSRLDREAYKKRGEEAIDAGWHEDKRYRGHHAQFGYTEDRKKTAEAYSNQHMEHLASTSRSWQEFRGQRRLSEDVAKAYQQEEQRAYEEIRQGDERKLTDTRFANLTTDAHLAQRRIDVADSAINAAKAIQREEWGQALVANQEVQVAAGGIAGADRALASGIAEYRKAYGDRVNEAQAILKQFNLSSTQRQQHALGEEVAVTDSYGNLRVLRADSTFTREAAIESQLTTGTAKEIEDIVKESGGKLSEFRTTIAAKVAENKLSGKAVYLGGQTINEIGQGWVNGDAGLDRAVRTTILKGKIAAGDLATNDATALERIVRVIGQGVPADLSDSQKQEYRANVNSLFEAAKEALTNGNLKGSIKENSRVHLEELARRASGGPTPGSP